MLVGPGLQRHFPGRGEDKVVALVAVSAQPEMLNSGILAFAVDHAHYPSVAKIEQLPMTSRIETFVDHGHLQQEHL